MSNPTPERSKLRQTIGRYLSLVEVAKERQQQVDINDLLLSDDEQRELDEDLAEMARTRHEGTPYDF